MGPMPEMSIISGLDALLRLLHPPTLSGGHRMVPINMKFATKINVYIFN
jgi:hypothetical protein